MSERFNTYYRVPHYKSTGRELSAKGEFVLASDYDALLAERDAFAAERDALLADRENAVKNAMDRLPEAPWKDKTATEAVWLLSLAVTGLTSAWLDLTVARAAGGVAPCPPLHYAPEDVAFSSRRRTDAELDAARQPGESRKAKVKLRASDMEARWLKILAKFTPENDLDTCPWLQDCLIEFAEYVADHVVIDVPSAFPSAAQVDALAMVLDTAYEIEGGGHTMWRDQSPYHQDRRRAQARAAFDHIGGAQAVAPLQG